jgi:hypothetical protein
MDELLRQIAAATDVWIATLTPEQRLLAKAGALRPENQTPRQLELLAKIPIPKGLTPQQSARLGYLSVVEEGRERGERAGAAIAFRAWLMVGAVCLLCALILLDRCA